MTDKNIDLSASLNFDGLFVRFIRSPERNVIERDTRDNIGEHS